MFLLSIDTSKTGLEPIPETGTHMYYYYDNLPFYENWPPPKQFPPQVRPRMVTLGMSTFYFTISPLYGDFCGTVKPWYSGLIFQQKTVHYFKDSTISNQYWKLWSINLKRRKRDTIAYGVLLSDFCGVPGTTYLS